MAIVLIDKGKTQHWTGSAAERAAMVTAYVSAGSTFTESDTGLEYMWSGAAWFKRIFPAA